MNFAIHSDKFTFQYDTVYNASQCVTQNIRIEKLSNYFSPFYARTLIIVNCLSKSYRMLRRHIEIFKRYGAIVLNRPVGDMYSFSAVTLSLIFAPIMQLFIFLCVHLFVMTLKAANREIKDILALPLEL